MLTTVEKAITKRIVKSALNQGYLVGASADDSADCDPCQDIEKILAACFAYDCVDLSLAATSDDMPSGWIALNYFNDGLEIITDYSGDLEDFVDNLSFKQLVIDL
jgi:hypothetical protein